MKISVIIPCYNVEPYIDKAVQSVFHQNHKSLELICVNDGSTDGTLKELERLKKISTIDMIIIDVKNGGACKARNIGIRNSNAEYFQFLDADDWLSKDKISTQVDIALKNNCPSIVVGSFIKINEAGEELEIRQYINEERKLIWDRLMSPDLGNTCSNLFSAQYFNQGGSWDESLKSSQEYTLMFNILKWKDNVIFDKEVNTTIVKRNSGSISLSNLDGNHERYLSLRIAIRDYLLENKIKFDTQYYEQLIFDRIRILYKFNRNLALSYYNKCVSKNFIPTQTEVTNSLYIKLFKVLGFSKTEKLKSILKK